MNLNRLVLVGLLGLPFLGSVQEVEAQDAVAALESALTVRYQEAMGTIFPGLLRAQAALLSARGFHEEAESLRLTAEQSVAAAGKVDPKVQATVIAKATEGSERSATMLTIESDSLGDVARDSLKAGVFLFAKGVAETAVWSKTLGELPPLVAGISSVRDPRKVGKAKSLANAAKGLIEAAPSLMTGNAKVIAAIRAYSASNRLELPPDAFGNDFPMKPSTPE